MPTDGPRHDADVAPRVSVCVVVKDRVRRMQRCLAAIAALDDVGGHEVVVVDNGSTDGTLEVLQRFAATAPVPVTVVEQPTGTLGEVRNAAVDAARAPVVAFTDSDCLPRPDWLRAGLAALDADPAAGVVQGRTVAEHHPPSAWAVTQQIDGPTWLFEACNLFVRRAPLLAAGGFGEALGFFGEDTVAGWRVVRAGWEAAFADDAVVAHDVTEPGFGWHLRRASYYRNWPALVREVPELRAHTWHRVFLRPRSALALLTLVGGVAAALVRRPSPLLLALPLALRHRPHAATPAALRDTLRGITFDLAVEIALVRGTIRHREVLL